MEKPISELPMPSRRDLLRMMGPAVAVGLAGCTGDSDDGGDGGSNANDDGGPVEVTLPDEDQTGGTLNVGMQPGVETMDGRSVSGLQSRQIHHNIYSKLLRWDPRGDELTLVGDLATEWEYETDTELAFELNDDATFHNGNPVTAEDVVHTYDTMLEGSALSGSSYYEERVQPVAIDEQTVVFETGEETFASLEAALAHTPGIINIEADESGDMAREPVGSGPFVFEEWVEGDHVYVTRNEDYWKTDENGIELPYLDRIEFQIYPSNDTKRRQFEQDTEDFIDTVPDQNVEDYLSNDSIKTRAAGIGAWNGLLMFNTTQPPFDDQNMRKAVVHAVDWEALVTATFEGIPDLTNNTPLSPETGWHYEDIENPYSGSNPEEAQRLIDESDIDPADVEFVNPVRQGVEHEGTSQEIILEQLSDTIGIEFEIEQLDGSTVFQRWGGNEFGFAIVRFNGFLDPDMILSAIYGDTFFNIGDYLNDQILENLQQGRTTTDREERESLYREILKTNIDEVGKYWPYWDNVTAAMKPSVTNFAMTLPQYWNFEDIWMET